MIYELTLEELLPLLDKGDITAIDVRSPAEFARGTIPGSRNIPLFDDSERQAIAETYRKSGLHAAKTSGLEIVAGKLPAFIRELREIEGRKAVFCLSGGIRSKIAVTALMLLDGRVCRVAGGYRAYFRHLRARSPRSI